MVHHRHDNPAAFDTVVERRPPHALARPGPPAPPEPGPGFDTQVDGSTQVASHRRKHWVRPMGVGPIAHRAEPAEPQPRVEAPLRVVARDGPPELDFLDVEFEEIDGSEIIELDPRDVRGLTFAEALEVDTRVQMSPGLGTRRQETRSQGDGFDLDLEFDERFRRMTQFVRLSRRASVRLGWVERVDAFGERFEHAVRRLADALSRRLRALAMRVIARSGGAHLDGPPRF